MSDYVITTDNNADLPDEYYKEKGIGCAYFTYLLDGENHTHDDFLPVEDFYSKMRSGSMPTTAQVNPQGARELMEPYLKEGKDVLHIAFSSGLSGTYNSFCVAADELNEEYPNNKVVVVDSLAASLGQGMIVYLAEQKKAEGATIEEVAKWVEENRNHIVHLFTVDDLDHLYRGGRVSKTTAVVGGMLNIKPILHVDDEGRLIPIGKVRGRKKSILELVKLMDQKIGSYHDGCDTIFISHGDCRDDAEYLAAKVKEKYQVKTELINYVGSVIGAHSGPGTLALFFLGDSK